MTDTQRVPATSTWTIDPAHSEVGFAVKHMMFSTVRGRFTGVTGTISLDERDVTGSSVTVEIATASIATHDEGRDTHLRSGEFFDVEPFPTITFRSTSVEPAGDDDLRIAGTLRIRDVEREAVLDATFNGRGPTPFGHDMISYSATTAINRKDYGLTWNAALESGGVLVGEDVKISIDIEATA